MPAGDISHRVSALSTRVKMILTRARATLSRVNGTPARARATGARVNGTWARARATGAPVNASVTRVDANLTGVGVIVTRGRTRLLRGDRDARGSRKREAPRSPAVPCLDLTTATSRSSPRVA